MEFVKLQKLKKGDKVAIISPSFAAPAVWPHIYQLGLERLRKVFELEPVEFKYTSKLNSSKEERAEDLIEAFSNREIKAVIASLGGDDQITYIKNLPVEVFINNPKPFFGFSDNTHLHNFLWLNGIPSYYGANLFTQFAFQVEMNQFTIDYIKHAFFDEGEFDLKASKEFNDEGLDWSDKETINQLRKYELNVGWNWNGDENSEGTLWGGCLESIDELLRHQIKIPTLDEFKNIILITETSEEMPDKDYVFRVYRALGELGILESIQGILVGRPKAWEFNKPNNSEQKSIYKKEQIETIIKTTRQYNNHIPIIQNLDFGHTEPNIPMPLGRKVRIESSAQKIYAEF